MGCLHLDQQTIEGPGGFTHLFKRTFKLDKRYQRFGIDVYSLSCFQSDDGYTSKTRCKARKTGAEALISEGVARGINAMCYTETICCMKE
jgi:hypothetical protein